MAFTGSSRAAVRAGKNPAIKPITDEIIIPLTILAAVNVILKSVKLLTTWVPIKIRIKPTIPPITERTTASKINCSRIK
jgi:hypothetical protein